jgi:hypothetical protein
MDLLDDGMTPQRQSANNTPGYLMREISIGLSLSGRPGSSNPY